MASWLGVGQVPSNDTYWLCGKVGDGEIIQLFVDGILILEIDTT